MATRNLTDIFILMRNNASHNRNIFSEQSINDRMALVEAGEAMELNKTVLPPVWIHVLDEVQLKISRIEKKLNDLSEHQQMFLSKPTLDDSNDQEILIENRTNEITKLFNNTYKLIRQIQEQSLDYECNQEGRLAKNVTTSLCTSLQNHSVQFRNLQSSYLQKIKSRETRANNLYLGNNDDVSPLGDDFVLFSKDDEVGDVDRVFELGNKYSTIQKQQILIEEDNAKIAEERREEVNKIVGSIADLNYIFKDLGRMVNEQGTLLDRIDYNIEQTQTQVRRAYQELAKADRYHKRNRKMQCILILAPATIILFLLLIIVKF